MELIVRGGGIERELEIVETATGGYEVRIGERAYRVDAASVSATARSLVIDGRQFEIGVHPLGNGRFSIETAAGVAPFEVLDPLGRLAEETREGSGSGGDGRVTAYMPGRVVTLLVSVGDAVAAGQGLVVLEAMKMENEIQADRDGVVAKILVEPGQAIEGGDPLFEIE